MVERGKYFDRESWEDSLDLTSLSEARIKELLATLCEEELRVSYRRRALHGRIDLLRSELVRRGGTSVSPDHLAQALMGDAPFEAEEAGRGPEHSDEHPEHPDEHSSESRGERPGEASHPGRGVE